MTKVQRWRNNAERHKFEAATARVHRTVRMRRVQSFFRAAVVGSYEGRYAISGLAEQALLVAGHIISWSDCVERRADPANGLCIDRVFGRGPVRRPPPMLAGQERRP